MKLAILLLAVQALVLSTGKAPAPADDGAKASDDYDQRDPCSPQPNVCPGLCLSPCCSSWGCPSGYNPYPYGGGGGQNNRLYHPYPPITGQDCLPNPGCILVCTLCKMLGIEDCANISEPAPGFCPCTCNENING